MSNYEMCEIILKPPDWDPPSHQSHQWGTVAAEIVNTLYDGDINTWAMVS
ncbi:MAG: hypothetical protein CM15mP54_13970 [Paracoccaceae bacterium]|nr:MAG: hypothetical protein CM15mP54_13970 [Paracoccaceae bacterium]